jgi:hypothetical protein
MSAIEEAYLALAQWGDASDSTPNEVVSKRLALALHALVGERQGPITDAQITAALVGWEGQPTRVDAMRAALEAARGVS